MNKNFALRPKLQLWAQLSCEAPASSLILVVALLLSLLAVPARAQYTPVIANGSGTRIGTNPQQAVGFLGANPVPQQSGSAELALSDSTGGVIPASVTITGTVANVVATGTLTITSSTGTALRLYGVLPGDTVLSATYVSGTTTLSGTADFEATISGSNQIVQTGTSSGVGTAVTVTVGRYPTASYFVLLSGSNATNINANFSILTQTVNEIRSVLVKFGLMKGSP